MKVDILYLIFKIVKMNPYIDGKCRFCGGSEKSNHYPNCLLNDVNRIIEKYQIWIPDEDKIKSEAELKEHLDKKSTKGAELKAKTPAKSSLPKKEKSEKKS